MARTLPAVRHSVFGSIPEQAGTNEQGDGDGVIVCEVQQSVRITTGVVSSGDESAGVTHLQPGADAAGKLGDSLVGAGFTGSHGVQSEFVDVRSASGSVSKILSRKVSHQRFHVSTGSQAIG